MRIGIWMGEMINEKTLYNRKKKNCICIATMKMHDTRYMRGLIPFQAYVNLRIQNRISLRKGEKKSGISLFSTLFYSTIYT
jgi:hypothetical protein